LSGQVDRLESENDRYGSLNDNLNYTVQEIQDLKDQLNATTNRLDVVSQELNATNYEFSLRIDELMEENQEYAMLNAELIATSMELSTQVDRFHGAIAELILENAAITDLSDELADLTGSLQGIGVDQNATIAALELTLRAIVTENSRLDDLNKDLSTIVSFLNDTSAGLDDSLQQVTQFLAGQITANRVLVLGSIESNYRQKISNWDCDYRDVFREFDYGFDYDTQIPQSDFEPVVSYVNVRVLEEMCLSDTDFADYVSDTYPSDLTSARLITAVTVYTTQALDWYFPESSEEGVSSNEWSDAGYQCENLPNRFVYNDARTRNRH
jgi:predicted  nucleic acid-binding Zn-ribbon protein